MIITKLIHDSPDSTQLVPLSINTKNRVIIKAQYSMISLGTERLVAEGKVNNDYYEFMKVPYMDGNFNLPCTYGYSMVGEYYSSNSLSKSVHLMHPHQDYALVKNSDLYELPIAIDGYKATFASNMETAVNAIWDAEVLPNEKILVAGLGSVGIFTAFCAKEIGGAKVFVLDANSERLALAKSLGFETWNERESINSAFNTTGSEDILQLLVDNVRKEGKVIELSWYGKKEVKLNLGGEFHFGRKKIISSQVSTVSPHKKGYDYKKRKDLVFNLLSNSFFDQIPVNFISFQEAPKFFNDLRRGQIKDVINIIKY